VKNVVLVLDKTHDALYGINENLDPDELEQKAVTQYDNSVGAYEALTPDTTSEQLHKLRINFKISRYALEFIQESGIAQVEKKIKRCKKIQDELGAVQDAKNQLKLLKWFCKKSRLDECGKLLNKRKREYKNLKHLATSTQSA